MSTSRACQVSGAPLVMSAWDVVEHVPEFTLPGLDLGLVRGKNSACVCGTGKPHTCRSCPVLRVQHVSPSSAPGDRSIIGPFLQMRRLRGEEI